MLNKEDLANYVKKTQFYRVPDMYSANGIFDRHTNITFKKKAGTLF